MTDLGTAVTESLQTLHQQLDLADLHYHEWLQEIDEAADGYEAEAIVAAALAIATQFIRQADNPIQRARMMIIADEMLTGHGLERAITNEQGFALLEEVRAYKARMMAEDRDTEEDE